MGQIKPKEYELKTGEKLTVRAAVPDDAPALIEQAHIILTEDLYNITTFEEFEMTVEKEREWIQEHIDHPARIVLVAELAGSIAGGLGFENSSRKRLEHHGILHMGVHPQFRDKGVGTALVQSLIDWAKQNPIVEKLCLIVFATNEPAIRLYKKMGFLEEGRRLRHVTIADGEYVDAILMARFVED
ncbi:MAG: GNAT family N-acetyltransferase [Planctomycetota bacterium]|jgi:RimJ/RimL family protein N-acetyltransferase